MTNTTDNDPISQLPEPYRVAWNILHEPFDHESMLRSVLINAQKMAGADWGMMILETDLKWPHHSALPGFHTLPNIVNNTIPIGHVSSLAYVLGRKAIQDGQSILIADTNKIIELDEARLRDDFLSLETRMEIKKHVGEKWSASSFLEIPNASSFTAMVVPIIEKNKNIGAIYLHRHLSQGTFSNELIEKIKIFLSCVAIGITNAENIENTNHLAFQLIYTFTSEFRTPLTALHGYAQILLGHPLGLKEDLGQNTEAENSFLKIILDYADRMRNLLDSLLMEARVVQGLVYKLGVNLNDVISPVVDKYQSLINNKHQSLVLDLPKSLDVKVEADRYLSEVIDMFMRGAHLYSPDGGEIKISISFNEDSFQFRISDSGPSLTQDDQAHLFQKHYHSTRNEAIQDSGLDLYLAKRLIELWGGQISVVGSPNQGNTFWFTIPLTKE